MRKSFAIAVGAGAMLIAGSLLAAPAGAQSSQTTQTTQTTRSATTGDIVGPHNPYCGAWVDGAFQPNGSCVTETTTTTTTTSQQPAAATVPGAATGAVVIAAPNGRVAERISGKIIAVNGHMVTLQHGDRTLIVNDSRALSREDTGRVATGRDIIAHGYWEDGTFFANRFE
jgi:hypothetical protein